MKILSMLFFMVAFVISNVYSSVLVCDSFDTQISATLSKYEYNNNSVYDLSWKVADGYENSMRFEQGRGIKLDHSEKLILEISSGIFTRESKKEFWKFNLSKDSNIATLDIKVLNRSKTEVIQRIEKQVLFCLEKN